MKLKYGLPSSVLVKNDSALFLSKLELFSVLKTVMTDVPGGVHFTRGEKQINVYVKDVPEFKVDNDGEQIVVSYPVNLAKRLNQDNDEDYNYVSSLNRAGIHKKPKVVLFKNIIQGSEMMQATFYLASALKKRGIEVIISDVCLDFCQDVGFRNLEALQELLETDSDISMVCITMLEDYFQHVKELARFIRQHSRAFIVAGGIMPTLTPEHVFLHLKEANFVVRGMGEKVLPDIFMAVQGKNAGDKLSEEELGNLRLLDGVYFSSGDVLLSCHTDKMNVITNLDEAEVDFSLLSERDIKRGLALSTSRGCLLNCRFCSLPVKSNFYYKTPENIRGTLTQYQSRLIELFGTEDNIPESAYVVSFYDEDFFAHKKRAVEIINFFKKGKFKIGSVEACIKSFFDKNTKQIDSELLDSLTPDVFAKTYRTRDVSETYEKSYVKPYEQNPFIQFGTESFCNKELKYLGKGHTKERALKLIDELARRGIVQTHYIILSNTYTGLQDIMETLKEIARLKVKYGRFFNVRRPIVRNLCSYYPSATFQEILKNGDMKYLTIRSVEKIPGMEEYDYYFVEKDNPKDVLAKRVVESFDRLFHYDNCYFEVFKNIFSFLEKDGAAAFSHPAMQDGLRNWSQLLVRATREKTNYVRALGKKSSGRDKVLMDFADDIKRLDVYRRYLRDNTARVTFITTHDCQLRCRYCFIQKSKEKMSDECLGKAMEMIFTTEKQNILVNFFGVEPLTQFELLQRAVACGESLSKRTGKTIAFYLTTNGVFLNQKVVDFIGAHNFRMEFSLDGEECTQVKNRPAIHPYDSYNTLIDSLPHVKKLKTPFHVIMVTSPASVDNLFNDFKHLVELGLKKIQINFAVGLYWKDGEIKVFAENLYKIGKEFLFNSHREIEFMNAKEWSGKPRLFNGEVTVDCDGSVYSGNGFLQNRKIKPFLVMGNVMHDDKPIDYYQTHKLPYCYMEKIIFSPHIMKTNFKMEKVMGSFVEKVFESRKC